MPYLRKMQKHTQINRPKITNKNCTYRVYLGLVVKSESYSAVSTATSTTKTQLMI